MKDLVGNLLIAPPSVKGNFFEKTVILLTEDHINGTVGVTLNKPSTVTLKEFARQNNVMLDMPNHYVHVGGPVNVKALTMIHTNEWRCANTMRINSMFSISSSPEILTNLAMGYTPKQWRIFVGLCGWSKGQLKQEMEGVPPYNRNQSWLTATADLDTVFDYSSQEQWTEAVERSGSEFAQKFFA
jgi:putative transcriptional regulator